MLRSSGAGGPTQPSCQSVSCPFRCSTSLLWMYRSPCMYTASLLNYPMSPLLLRSSPLPSLRLDSPTRSNHPEPDVPRLYPVILAPLPTTRMSSQFPSHWTPSAYNTSTNLPPASSLKQRRTWPSANRYSVSLSDALTTTKYPGDFYLKDTYNKN